MVIANHAHNNIRIRHLQEILKCKGTFCAGNINKTCTQYNHPGYYNVHMWLASTNVFKLILYNRCTPLNKTTCVCKPCRPCLLLVVFSWQQNARLSIILYSKH